MAAAEIFFFLDVYCAIHKCSYSRLEMSKLILIASAHSRLSSELLKITGIFDFYTDLPLPDRKLSAGKP